MFAKQLEYASWLLELIQGFHYLLVMLLRFHLGEDVHYLSVWIDDERLSRSARALGVQNTVRRNDVPLAVAYQLIRQLQFLLESLLRLYAVYAGAKYDRAPLLDVSMAVTQRTGFGSSSAGEGLRIEEQDDP